MGKRIVIVGAGAVGSYAGAHMARAGEDVTFIDPWPQHVEHMRAQGLRVSHAAEVEEFTVPVRALHVTDAQLLSREAPVDIAFVCMKAYDTSWATALIAQYLAADGYVVSLQNCINEETIAEIVGWGRTLGCIASQILVELYEPGHVHRGAGKGGAKHTVFRAGELHGRATSRAAEVAALVGHADSALVTTNLWGERWSKLVANVMYNGLSAATGLSTSAMLESPTIRRFAMRLGAEAIRVGEAHGYALEEIYHFDPETLARAGEGDAAAAHEVEARMLAGNATRSAEQRPSMGQDMLKGRRTEIEFLNGFVVRKGGAIGVATPANAALTDIVRRVERGAAPASPEHIETLRFN